MNVRGDNNRITVNGLLDAKEVAKALKNELKEEGSYSVGESASTSETKVDELPPVFGLFTIGQKALEAVVSNNLERAVEFASIGYDMATNAIAPYMGKEIVIRSGFANDYFNVAYIVAQNEMCSGNYESAKIVCDRLSGLFGDYTPPFFVAFRMAAALRAKGKRQIFPTDATVKKLEKMKGNPERLSAVIEYLIRWGYLSVRRPDLEKRQMVGFPIFESLGLRPHEFKEGESLMEFRASCKARTGETLHSHAISMQWVGFNSFEGFDMTDEEADALGIPAAERSEPPILASIVNAVYNPNAKDPKRNLGIHLSCSINPKYMGPHSIDPDTLEDSNAVKIPEPTSGVLAMLGFAILLLGRKR